MLDYFNRQDASTLGFGTSYEEAISIQFFTDFYPHYELTFDTGQVGRTRRFALENDLIGKSLEEIKILYNLIEDKIDE